MVANLIWKTLVLTFLISSVCVGEDVQLEPGYKSLFNGKDLTGWKLKSGGESLDGKTETEKKRFQVQDGNLVIDGKARGNMVIETQTQFGGDVHIRFEFMPGENCNNDLYIRGLKFDIKKGAVKKYELGKWHKFEIIIRGKEALFKSDGDTLRVQKTKTDMSPLGVRAEFGAIKYRHLCFKQLD